MKKQKNFGIKLRKLRKTSGITQNELAHKLNLSPSTIGMYEQGRRKPDSKILVKIANLFNISVDYLLESKTNSSKFNNIDELSIRVASILKKNKKLKNIYNTNDQNYINNIVDAVREGIHQAFDEIKSEQN